MTVAKMLDILQEFNPSSKIETAVISNAGKNVKIETTINNKVCNSLTIWIEKPKFERFFQSV